MATTRVDFIERFVLILLSGFLFWPNAVSSVSLILLVLFRFWKVRLMGLPMKSEWILLTPAIIMLLAWAMHGFSTDGPRELQLWATWLAALLYFRTSPHKRLFLQAFTILSIAQALAVLSYFSFSAPIPSDNISQYLRDSMGETFHVHPTYMSAIWLWAAFIIMSRGWWRLTLRIPAAVLLILVATVAGGKMPLLAFGILTTVWVFFQVRPPEKRAVIVVGWVVIVLGNLFFNPFISSRFNEIPDASVEYHENQWLSSTDVRLGVWSCAVESTRQHWLAGVGVGNTRSMLESCYEDFQQTEFFVTEFNTHNLLLHYWLCGGVFSVLSLVAWLIWIGRIGFNRKQENLLYFLLYFSLIALTENYLTRQAGMMFAGFFIMLYFFQVRDQPSSTTHRAK